MSGEMFDVGAVLHYLMPQNTIFVHQSPVLCDERWWKRVDASFSGALKLRDLTTEVRAKGVGGGGCASRVSRMCENKCGC
jgi:hypothetical protein